MPELPDLTVYLEGLEKRIANRRLERVCLRSPFLLRTAVPAIETAHGRKVAGVLRVGKRIVIALQGGLYLVIHLMIAGRLHWESKARNVLARFEFENGTLSLSEAGTKRRASLHLVTDLRAVDPGGLEPLEADFETFRDRLLSENHTLKRALTDPRLFAGIGNAYSDEILHAARLSPVGLTGDLKPQEVERLYRAARDVLTAWIARLRTDSFPEKVTAFREGMAVHGRYGKPCPVCAAPVQRIVYAESETNYCARCQTGGRILADRALSRLLKKSWPRSLDDLS